MSLITRSQECGSASTPRELVFPVQLKSAWITAALILGSFVFVRPQPGFAQTTYCPESVFVNQAIDKIPEGWTPGQEDVPSALAGIAFFSGPPEEKAALVYNRWTKRSGLAYAVWHFQPKSSHRIWLTCRYSFTRVVLTKQLPASTSECTVTYDLNVSVSGEPTIRKMVCH